MSRCYSTKIGRLNPDPSPADQAASKLANCHIVSLEWFLESSVATKPVPEKPYFLGSGQNGVVQDIQKNGTQTEATGTKRAVKQNDESNGDPHKMRKDSQRISFKTLNVPVDEEYFIESGYFAGEVTATKNSRLVKADLPIQTPRCTLRILA